MEPFQLEILELQRQLATTRLVAEAKLAAERAARVEAEEAAAAAAASAASVLSAERAARIEAEEAVAVAVASAAAAVASTAAAVASASAERAARIEAEEAAAVAVASAAAAAASAASVLSVERAARIDAEVDAFLNEMRGVAGSSSADTSSHADVLRRGATNPVLADAEAVLAGLPLPARGSVARAWAAFAQEHAGSWTLPPPPPLAENRDVHPTVARLLGAVVAHDALRVWHEGRAEDDVPAAKIRPDFLLTHARDAGASTIGAAIMVEVKLPGCLDDASVQLCAYLRRRVYKLCCERRARGEPFDDIFALGAATDGLNVVLVRMLSGAPALGGAFKTAKPCPSVTTRALPLLAGWDFCTGMDFAQRAPLPGFVALAHLCGSAGALGAGAPLASLSANVAWEGGAGAPPVEGGGGGVPPRDLALGARLGLGGTSDVYEFIGDEHAIVKVARCLTPAATSGFEAEVRALQLLRHAAHRGLVPELLGVGARAPDARAGAHSGGAWPLLILRPRGLPLAAWVAARVAAAPRRGAREARRAAASAIILRVLEALEAAAAAGVVHCDVRPANIVVVGDAAALVDWGCSCAPGEQARGRGVAAFSDARVFAHGQASFPARPAQDVAGALFSWLAIACDAGCAAPWQAPTHAPPEVRSTVHDVLARRAAWLAAAAERGDISALFVDALAAATAGAGEDFSGILALARAAVFG